MIRGLAVLGILVINVTTMAGPSLAAITPDWNGSATPLDWTTYGITWLLFEGKMRALFATLFGASLALYLDRAGTAPRTMRQVRRMLWLALFGYLHFLLLWWGDILFTYAIAGLIALLFRNVRPSRLIGSGIAIYALYALISGGSVLYILMLSHGAGSGGASADGADILQQVRTMLDEEAAARMREYAMGFWQAVAFRLDETPFFPLTIAASAVPEALPLMLCGMGLARSGFFRGEWPRRTMVRIAVVGAIVGLAWYGGLFAYAASQDFSLTTLAFLPFQLGMIGRFAMAAAILSASVLLAPAILRSDIGKRVESAGRMALSNYLGSSLVMTFLFNGWGFGLADERFGHAVLMLFVLLGWALMLGWSLPWLRRFGIGPLELAWRKLSGMQIRRAERPS